MVPPPLPPPRRLRAPSSRTLFDSVFFVVHPCLTSASSLPPDRRRSLRSATPASLRARCCASCRVEPVPPPVACRPVSRRQCPPFRPRDPVQVVHDLPVLHRQLAHEALGRVHAGAIHVGKTKPALFEAQHGNIRHGSD